MSKPQKPTSQTLRSAAALARWAAEDSVLFTDAESPFHASLAKGAAKLVVVTGENASGKSLFVRVAGAALQRYVGGTPVSISIRERTGAGHSEVGGLRRVMMFGDEQEQSTGATSTTTVATAFNNLDRPKGSILILDEPELGLSDGYTRAMGEYIGRQTLDIPSKCKGVFVVTHSRALVRGLIDGYGKTPTHALITAEQPGQAGIAAWMDISEQRSVEDLLALRDVGHDRWKRANVLIKG